jgi:signal transduction histidine kinase
MLKRDWALELAPGELSGRPEGFIFACLCIVALALVALADVGTHEYGTIGGIAFLTVLAAAWLLSDRLTLVVVGVAVALAVLTAMLGPVAAVTALTRIILLPILAVLARLAATTVVRIHRSEMLMREARAAEVRMRELEQAKSEFLRLASHELRGPIAILRGYLNMLEDGTLGALPPMLDNVVPVLVASAAGINHTIDQMLDAARLEDSRLQIQPEPTDLALLVRETAANVELLHGGSHQVVCLGCRQPVQVEVDANRIETVIGNLVSNALKYSPAGSQVDVLLEKGPMHARVHVRDRGVGIPAADMQRLFTRFGRLERPETNDVPGTGLGLYLSRELARMHGGDITVVSTPGSGSIFSLELPLPGSWARHQEAKLGRRGVDEHQIARRREAGAHLRRGHAGFDDGRRAERAAG